MANQVGGDGYQPDQFDDGIADHNRRSARDRREGSGERRLAGWQRALRWAAWLGFLGVSISDSVRHPERDSFGALAFLALAVAIGVSIWCMAKPLGGPKVDIEQPAQARGTFVSRTSWGLVLLGVALTVGGVGATGAIVYDLSTGRATVKDVLHDMAIFVEGWMIELFTGGSYDAELEKTHAYALFILVIPGLLLVCLNLVPFFRRGREFRVEPDGSISVRNGQYSSPVMEYEYSAVNADGTTIRFTPSDDRTPALVLPQARVFCRENGARLQPGVSGQLFAERLAGRGFTVADVDAKNGHFRASSGRPG